jgi:hypothetical protein
VVKAMAVRPQLPAPHLKVKKRKAKRVGHPSSKVLKRVQAPGREPPPQHPQRPSGLLRLPPRTLDLQIPGANPGTQAGKVFLSKRRISFSFKEKNKFFFQREE